MHSTSSSHWKKEPKENESKDTKVVAFVKTKNQRSLAKGQKED
jgi:hypothetical protein